jgi:non-ribosomal peptide synthetase component F
MFVNTIVLRNRVSAKETFASLLRREKKVVHEALEHQMTPFELVVDAVGVERSMSRPPLYQVIYVHQGTVEDIGFARTKSLDVDATTSSSAQVDLTISTVESGERIGVTWLYNIDLFDRGMVEQMARHFVQLLDQVTSLPEARLGHIELLDLEERRRVLTDWVGTRTASSDQQCIHELFEAEALRRPDAIAVTLGDEQLTYADLDARANHLAGRLVAAGSRVDELVGVVAERGVDTIVALLAILKAGCGYLPLDLDNPVERLALLVREGGVRVAVGQSAHADAIPGIEQFVAYERSGTRDRVTVR